MRAWLLAGLFFGTAAACGTDAVGVETCKKIEHIRCQWAQECGINLDMPVVRRRSNSTSPVDDCFRYYDDACLHGLTVADPNDAGAVQACADQIDTGNCDWVLHPENAPACSWLIPPPDSGVDTGVDSGTTD